jgi:hypothetical protein
VKEPSITRTWAAKEISDGLTAALGPASLQSLDIEDDMTDSLGFGFNDWDKPLVIKDDEPDPYDDFRARYIGPIVSTLALIVRAKSYRALARPAMPADGWNCVRVWSDGAFAVPVSMEWKENQLRVGISGR